MKLLNHYATLSKYATHPITIKRSHAMVFALKYLFEGKAATHQLWIPHCIASLRSLNALHYGHVNIRLQIF